MRYKKIKKGIVTYFTGKIEEQKLPVHMESVYNSAGADKFPGRKKMWIKKPVPVFGMLLLIVISGYIILTNIFSPAPGTSELEELERIFSKIPQFQVVLKGQKGSEERKVPKADECFLLEMIVKSALFTIHNESYSNVELADLFKRGLSHTPTIKRKGTIIFPDWKDSQISELEKKIKKMIEEKHVFLSLKKIKKS